MLNEIILIFMLLIIYYSLLREPAHVTTAEKCKLVTECCALILSTINMSKIILTSLQAE